MGPRIRVDLHVHSRASYDALSSVAAIIRAAKRRGLQGVAITDHDIFLGTERISSINGLKIIWGQEVTTTEGELIGLFLERPLRPRRSPEDTLDAIKEQGGVVYLPHPFKRTGRKIWSPETLDRIRPRLEVVEVFNGRLLDREANRAAAAWAEKWGIPAGAGSDAHTPWEVGRVLVEMEDFDSPAAFLANLREARIFGRPASRLGRLWGNRFVRQGWRRLKGRGL